MNIINLPEKINALQNEFLYQQSLITDDDLQANYNAYIQTADLSEHHCKSCHSKGTQKKHCTYRRSLITCREEVQHPRHIYLCVVKCQCEACKQQHHTLFPEWICPFLAYTYAFILEVLCYLYLETNNCSINKTAKHFGLERRTVRKFKQLFEEDEIPMRSTNTFQSMAEECKSSSSRSEIKNFLELLRAKKELFWSFLSEFIPHADHTFLAARLTYSKQGKRFHYITCPMGQATT